MKPMPFWIWAMNSVIWLTSGTQGLMDAGRGPVYATLGFELGVALFAAMWVGGALIPFMLAGKIDTARRTGERP